MGFPLSLELIWVPSVEKASHDLASVSSISEVSMSSICVGYRRIRTGSNPTSDVLILNPIPDCAGRGTACAKMSGSPGSESSGAEG